MRFGWEREAPGPEGKMKGALDLICGLGVAGLWVGWVAFGRVVISLSAGPNGRPRSGPKARPARTVIGPALRSVVAGTRPNHKKRPTGWL